MKKSKFTNLTATIMLIGVLIFLLIGVRGGGLYSVAAETVESGIIKELGGLKINGVPFSAEDYPADSEGTPYVLFLNEVGYSYYTNAMGAYALIAYVYNPPQLDVEDDIRNTIQIKAGKAERYTKYALKLLDRSEDKLFYKFKVDFTDSEKSSVLSSVDREKRVYEISSIELYTSGANATDYAMHHTQIFSYTGFAQGLGQSATADSTLAGSLEYTITGGHVPVQLKVNHTSWRPEGTNGRSNYTQDVIHSVYFAIPKECDEKYDYLNSVHARWLEARTTPIYVTGDEDIKNRVNQVRDENISSAMSSGTDLPKEFSMSGNHDGWGLLSVDRTHEDGCYYGYINSKALGNIGLTQGLYVINMIDAIYMSKYLENVGVVTSSEVEQMIKETSEYLAEQGFDDKKVAGKYQSALFESYDTEFTDATINLSDEFNLYSEQIERTFWDRLFGNSHITNKQNYTDMKAIQKISDSDLYGDEKDVVNKLYISARDFDDFKKYYDSNKENSSIYLLRFATSEYFSVAMNEYKWRQLAFYNKTGTGYIAQANAYLDFDIIDLDYVKGDEHFIIPVSMSPIDIFTELTPPPDYSISDFWIYGVAIIGGLIAFYIVYKFGSNIYEKSTRGL